MWVFHRNYSSVVWLCRHSRRQSKLFRVYMNVYAASVVHRRLNMSKIIRCQHSALVPGVSLAYFTSRRRTQWCMHIYIGMKHIDHDTVGFTCANWNIHCRCSVRGAFRRKCPPNRSDWMPTRERERKQGTKVNAKAKLTSYQHPLLLW